MSRVDVLVGARSNLSVKFLGFTRIVSKGRSKYALFLRVRMKNIMLSELIILGQILSGDQ